MIARKGERNDVGDNVVDILVVKAKAHAPPETTARAQVLVRVCVLCVNMNCVT